MSLAEDGDKFVVTDVKITKKSAGSGSTGGSDGEKKE